MIKSQGTKRTLSVLLFLLGQLAATDPKFAVYQPILDSLATVLGIAGVGHATLAGNLFPKK